MAGDRPRQRRHPRPIPFEHLSARQRQRYTADTTNSAARVAKAANQYQEPFMKIQKKSFSLLRNLGWLATLIAIAIVNPPSAKAGTGRDLWRLANRGSLPEATKINVPGKTVRVMVGEVETATWAGKPQWVVEGVIKFGPLRLTKDGTNIEWNTPDVHCLVVEDLKTIAPYQGTSYSEYDKKDNGAFESITAPIILEFVLPDDQRLYGQTLTAELAMNIAYLGLQMRPYQPPIISPMNTTMETPVAIKIASVEEAKKYSALADSVAVQQFKFYAVIIGCCVFLMAVGYFLWGRHQ
jgi:hypothetical protein